MNTMLLAALMIWGMTPGPQFIKNSPDLFWGLIASMYIGNVLLLVLNLPLIPLWVRVLKVPPVLLNVLVLIFCIIGVYSVNQQIEDVYVLLIFGVVGFLGKKLGYEGAPLILAFILGRRIEVSLRQSLIMSDGDFFIFVTRPISAVCIAITLAIVITAVIGTAKAKIKAMESDEEF
jgi:putative tricarboxylic transport membrane protein